MHKAHEVYDKLGRGDALTDEEVEFGRTFFRELEMKLMLCGPIFRLACSEAGRAGRQLDDFYRARRR